MPEKLNRTDDDIDLDDEDAQKLLAAAVEDDEDDDDEDRGKRDKDDEPRRPAKGDDGDPSQLGDPGKRALDAMKRDRNAARKELQEARAQLKKIADKDKSQEERLTEARDEAATRAAKAEEGFKALSVAMDRAPAHATLKHVRMVAKRIRGDSDDELETDADELFEMLVPAPKEKDEPPPRKVAGKPRERLRGGGDPEDEPEETDPRKLADMIRRSRF